MNELDFLTVYIKEAHPEDEWQLGANEKKGVCYLQPTNLQQRTAIANDFVERYSYAMPLVVDSMENTVEEAYAAWPERLYVVDENGRVAYKGGVGPFGFKPDELDSWLGQRLRAADSGKC